MKTYVFKFEVEQDKDGRWGADIPVLPGCAAWGYTRKEALEAHQDTAQVFLEVMIEHNDPLQAAAEEEGKDFTESDVVTITV